MRAASSKAGAVPRSLLEMADQIGGPDANAGPQPSQESESAGGSSSSASAQLPTQEAAQCAISTVVRDVLGSDVDPDQPLMEAGLDSLAAVELRNELGATLGLDLPATLMFDHPTVTALAAFVHDELQARSGGVVRTVSAAPQRWRCSAVLRKHRRALWWWSRRRASTRRARGGRDSGKPSSMEGSFALQCHSSGGVLKARGRRLRARTARTCGLATGWRMCRALSPGLSAWARARPSASTRRRGCS